MISPSIDPNYLFDVCDIENIPGSLPNVSFLSIITDLNIQYFM